MSLGEYIKNKIRNGNLPIDPIPSIIEWINVIEYYWIPIGFALLFTMITIILSGIHLYFILAYISLPNLQTDLYWMVFLCPIISLSGTIGMLIPRSAAFLYSIGVVYFLVCVFILVTLMTTLHGSRAAMCDKLMEKNIKLNPRVYPYACCFVCLKDIQPTSKNFRIIEWFVFQSPVIRIVVEILNLVVYYELGTKNNVFFQITDVTSTLSLFIASYGSYVLIPAGSKMLTHYRFLTLFRILDNTQFIYSLQMTVSTYLVRFGFYTKYKNLPETAHSQFWLCFLATFESVLASSLTTFFLRPSKSALFDKYPQDDKTCTPINNNERNIEKSPFYRQPILGNDDLQNPAEQEVQPFINLNNNNSNKNIKSDRNKQSSSGQKTPDFNNDTPENNIKKLSEIDVEPQKLQQYHQNNKIKSPISNNDENILSIPSTTSSRLTQITPKNVFSNDTILDTTPTK